MRIIPLFSEHGLSTLHNICDSLIISESFNSDPLLHLVWCCHSAPPCLTGFHARGSSLVVDLEISCVLSVALDVSFAGIYYYCRCGIPRHSATLVFYPVEEAVFRCEKMIVIRVLFGELVT